MSRTNKHKNYLAGPKAVYTAKYRASERTRVRDALRTAAKGEEVRDRSYVDLERYFNHYAYD